MELDAGPRELALAVLGQHPVGDDATREQHEYRNAVHEGGHALVAVLLGHPFRSVSVRPRCLTAGVTHDTVDSRLVGDVAGAVAELVVVGDVEVEGCVIDMRHATRIAGGDTARVRRAVERARAMLQQERAALDALGEWLAFAGKLTFDECKIIVRRRPPILVA